MKCFMKFFRMFWFMGWIKEVTSAGRKMVKMLSEINSDFCGWVRESFSRRMVLLFSGKFRVLKCFFIEGVKM